MSPYRVYITPEALAEIKDLPGNIRQRIRQTALIASYSAYAWIIGELFM